ncbi:hypothetical protein JRO89_XS09G0122000 [Xanthoceras sorbifolium]|uniref:Fanconi-associated nuclease n=1 Tax=Xanthoceras sorbifolium TaxID=99658 RepID=A0ABQ8HL79_9ROSI|nr:hypothetical protein JRO89_XS09G0122000 [Xanthoceras sorbifolium]
MLVLLPNSSPPTIRLTVQVHACYRDLVTSRNLVDLEILASLIQPFMRITLTKVLLCESSSFPCGIPHHYWTQTPQPLYRPHAYVFFDSVLGHDPFQTTARLLIHPSQFFHRTFLPPEQLHLRSVAESYCFVVDLTSLKYVPMSRRFSFAGFQGFYACPVVEHLVICLQDNALLVYEVRVLVPRIKPRIKLRYQVRVLLSILGIEIESRDAIKEQEEDDKQCCFRDSNKIFKSSNDQEKIRCNRVIVPDPRTQDGDPSAKVTLSTITLHMNKRASSLSHPFSLWSVILDITAVENCQRSRSTEAVVRGLTRCFWAPENGRTPVGSWAAFLGRPWFRLSNISYPEVSDLQEAIKELSANGFLCLLEDTKALDDNIKEICNLLSVSELREILSVLQKSSNYGSRKQDLIASLLCSYEDGLCQLLPSMVLDKTGICIRISPKAESLIWRAERLFFLNGDQNLSAFLLVDLGIVKYPIYNCIISNQIFSNHSDLLVYEEAIELAQIMDQSLDENNIELVLRCIMVADSRISSTCMELKSMDHCLHIFGSFWLISKCVLLLLSTYARKLMYNDAVNLLKRLLISFTCDGRRGYWTLRLSIDLEHMGCPNESLSVAEEGLMDPWVRAGSRMALQRRVLRLGKPPRRWKTPSFSESIHRKITEVHIQGRPLNRETGMKSRFYGEDGEQCGVEQLALQYYAGEGGGWQGVHSESGIWLTIFGLLMWDILFSDIPDVFRSRFQTAPLDLATDSFYVVRKNLIESQLQKIHDGMAEEIIITSWESHMGTACKGVNWDRHSLFELRAAVACIGGPCLASFCRHLAQDYGSWSSGMPDLLLWRFHEEYRGEAKLVEVKGPRDRLSEQQRAWLLMLMDCGFNVEVCKVSPSLFS